MPAPRRQPPLQEGAPRRAHERRPVARHATGALVHARRCPHCYGSLRELMPVPAQALEAATAVAWRTLDRRPATSADVAEYLTTKRHATPLSQAGDHLRRAEACGLVKHTVSTLPGGGRQYHYMATRRLVAYVEQDALARSLADTLGQVVERANRATSSVHGTLRGIAQAATQATRVAPN